MTDSGIVPDRLETLALARLATAPAGKRAPTIDELASGLRSCAPPTLDEARWRGQIGSAVQRLQDRGFVTPERRAVSGDELQHRIGPHSAKRWQDWSQRVLPGLALGVAPTDPKAHKRLADRDAWCAAITGRVLGLWSEGPPPSPAALGNLVVAHELGITGSPPKSPPWLRAYALRKHVAADLSSPEQLLRQFAVRAVAAPNAGIQAIYAGLIRSWLTGRALGGSLIDAVRSAAQRASDGLFGDRKVFIASLWHAVRATPPWSALALDDFKARLVAAHRKQELTLARADLVAAMDPALVASSETRTDGATFHFVVREPMP